ncbi:MAG TPA: menaquinol-cytochrome c reductase cytochrome b subunit [Actinomycetota bacterium]|nr:menaquinol-cytochrome c reductase cytochrome b subunit [Actinomycetota bacterium]
MAERAEELNKETFERVRDELLQQGMSPRVAEGKARRIAMIEYNKEHGEGPSRPAEGAAPDEAPAQPEGSPAAPAPQQVPQAPQPAGTLAAPPAAAVRTAPGPTGKPPVPKPGAPEKHRLLALVPPEGVQRVDREQGDRINVFPHLLLEELLSLLVVTAALIVFSTFVNAPLRELANQNLTPNPSKAPWYFLGLQELLRYFHPMVAGVTIPTVVFAFLFFLPYVDRNPSNKPGDRKMAIVLWTLFLMFWTILTLIGAFFRGPGFNFVWPWTDGIFFEL